MMNVRVLTYDLHGFRLANNTHEMRSLKGEPDNYTALRDSQNYSAGLCRGMLTLPVFGCRGTSYKRISACVKPSKTQVDVENI